MITQKDIYEWYHSVKKKRIQSVDLELVESLREQLKKRLTVYLDDEIPEYFINAVNCIIQDVFGVEGEK